MDEGCRVLIANGSEGCLKYIYLSITYVIKTQSKKVSEKHSKSVEHISTPKKYKKEQTIR